jgi:hypothetical protein
MTLSNRLYTWDRWNEGRQNRLLDRLPYPDPEVSTYAPRTYNRRNPGGRTIPTTTSTTATPYDWLHEFRDDVDNNDGAGPSNVNISPGKTRGADALEETQMAPPSNKRQKTNEEDGNTSEISGGSPESISMGSGGSPAPSQGPVDAGAMSSASSGALSSAASEKFMYVARPLTFRNRQSLVFNKVHKMLSYGLEFKLIKVGQEMFMTTSLLEVPWDRLFFYLSKNEFASLPQGARATHCEIKIIQRNTRVAFEAGASTSGLATLNQNKFGLKALNLPAKICGTNYEYSYVANNPMSPDNATEKQYASYATKLYGFTPLDANFENELTVGANPWHTLGIPFHFNSYFTMRSDNNTYASTNANRTKIAPGWGNYSQHIIEYDMNSFIGDMIHQQTYNFKCAPIKRPVVAAFPLNSNGSFQYNTHINYQYPSTKVITPGVGQAAVPADPMDDPDYNVPPKQPTTSWNIGSVISAQSYDYTIDSLIEKAPIFSKGLHRFDPQRQPSIHIGVKPIPKLSPILEIASAFTDAEAWFEVSATLHVTYDMNSQYPAYEGQRTTDDQILKGITVRPEDAMTETLSTEIRSNRPLMYGQYAN